MHIKLRADFADGKAAAGVEMVVPMPKDVQRVTCDPDPAHAKPAGNQAWDWQEKAGRLVWRFKKLPGGADATLKARPLAAVSHQEPSSGAGKGLAILACIPAACYAAAGGHGCSQHTRLHHTQRERGAASCTCLLSCVCTVAAGASECVVGASGSRFRHRLSRFPWRR